MKSTLYRSLTAFSVTAASVIALAACSSVGTAPASSSALTQARIAEILASPDRSDADRSNDQRRKPEQMLAFLGLRPGMVALDLFAGGGYTTELLARAVGPSGRVYGQSAPRPAATPPAQPEGAANPTAPAATGTPSAAANAQSGAAAAPRPPPRPSSPVALAARAQNPKAGNIIAVVQALEDPVPTALASNGLDLVTLMFNYHDAGHMGVDRARMNRAVFAALKSGGVYVIADHAGRDGSGISEAGTLHRIEETFLRKEVESAGFRFVQEGGFLRNPADPRDRNTPDPPQPKDQFVLKFVKP
jgi:predicted methyltransferase